MGLDFYLIAGESTQVVVPMEPTVEMAIAGSAPGLSLHEAWEAMLKVGGTPVPGAGEPIFSRNITHNLNTMAAAAGIYEVLWRPDEMGITEASQVIGPLSIGLEKLRSDPEKCRAYDSPNGWGVYEHFVPFVEAVLEACKANPNAMVMVSR